MKKSQAQPLTKGERTRLAVTAAAHRLFLSKGYHGTSMREIAETAGLALGGIYNHFTTKEEIFQAILLEHHPYRDVMPALQSAQGETVEELVRDAARQMLDRLGRRSDVLNLMFIEMVEFKGQHAGKLIEQMLPQVAEFGDRLMAAKGNLRPFPAPLLVRALVGLFFSYYITGLLVGKQLPAALTENAFDGFVEIYLHGILAQ